MLSNKLSSWLNGVTKDVDIGVNYRPGNALSSDELDLAFGVTDSESMSKALHEILVNGQRKNESALDQFIREYVYQLDGKTAERICDFIESHLK